VSDVNLDRLRELAGHLRDAVRQLQELARIPRELFLADPRAVNSAKYLLIDDLTQPGVMGGLIHRGGLRARILSEGVIRPGDVVRPKTS